MNARRFAVGLIGLGLFAAGAHAALVPLDSNSFAKKFEMNGSSILPDDNGTEWSYVGYGGLFSGEQVGGYMHLNTALSGATASSALYLDSTTYDALSTPGGAFTYEVSVQVTQSLEDLGGSDRAFYVIAGDGSAYSKLEVGLTTVWFSNTLIASGLNNSGGQHVYRVAKDGASGEYTVWRDNEALANNLGGLSHTFVDFYFGDGTGGWSGESYTDYFRWTLGGYSPIPEPGALSLCAIALTGLLRRRR